MRLIDADALMDEMFERYCKECDKRKGIKNGKYRIIYEVGDAPCRACEIDDMKSELEEAPTIEPKRGKWIKMSDADGMYYCCSECGEELYREWSFDREFDLFPKKRTIEKTRFCPNCGARMDL